MTILEDVGVKADIYSCFVIVLIIYEAKEFDYSAWIVLIADIDYIYNIPLDWLYCKIVE